MLSKFKNFFIPFTVFSLLFLFPIATYAAEEIPTADQSKIENPTATKPMEVQNLPQPKAISYQANKDIKIKFNNSYLSLQDTSVLIGNNRTLLPMRLLFEKMGATVQWNSKDKTITAVKDGIEILLTLNSKTVFKNGEVSQLDTTPVIVKSRTYVPLRFIGEAFGAEVNWYKDLKEVQVNIKVDPSLTNLNIQLNSKPLSFVNPPITLNNKTYLPFEEFLDAVDLSLSSDCNFSWQKADDGSFFISFDGINSQVYVDKADIIINDKNASTKEYPITYEGLVYMPLGFAKEILAANVFFDNPTQIQHIYINRAKFKSQFLGKEPIGSVVPTQIPQAKLVGERLLSVSDNPEILTPEAVQGDNSTLWMSPEISFKDTSYHRVFGWHVSQLGYNSKIGIVIENTGTTDLEIRNAKGFYRSSPNSWVHYDVGLPVAEAIISGFTNKTLPFNITIPAGEKMLLQEFQLNNGSLVGFINDFDIVNTNSHSNGQYQVRVAFSNDSNKDLTTISGAPVKLDKKNPHPRGTWLASEIAATTPTYEVGSPEIAYSISNGQTDNLYTLDSALKTESQILANPGHFGASYKITIPIVNNNSADQKIRIRLSARGGVYTGAIRTPDGVFLVPVLTAGTEVANLYDYAAAPGTSEIQLELMHAGGASLAVAIDILTLE